MEKTVRLTVLTGPHKGNRFCFRGSDPTTLGRGSGNDICLCGDPRDLCISRQHCRFLFTPPVLEIQDLCSANGTYVNGKTCKATACGSQQYVAGKGDIVTVGGTSLQVDVLECVDWRDDERIRKNCDIAC